MLKMDTLFTLNCCETFREFLNFDHFRFGLIIPCLCINFLGRFWSH